MSRKEIDKKFDDIVAFAELEEFIDDPVRTYSSGMYMRLGFSLAIHTDPDILLVDEVLAVGDVQFIHRCHDRISDLKRRGKTLIFVTHDLDSVKRWCDEAIWLNKGVVEARGEPQVVIDRYLSSVEKSEEESISKANQEIQEEPEVVSVPPESSDPEEEQVITRWGSGEVEISDVKALRNGQEHWLVHSGEDIEVTFQYKLKSNVKDLVFGLGLIRADGLTVFGTNTDIEGIDVKKIIGSNTQGVIRIKLDSLSLLEGTYFLDIAAHKSDGTPYDYHHLRYKLSVRNPKRYHGVYVPKHEWVISA
jgi:ABC-type sugar transport system ATPase subunit